MSSELPELLRDVPASALQDQFILYKCKNLVTDCEYQHLATNLAQSIFLSFGEHMLVFELALPEDAERWLIEDYVETAERFTLRIETLRDLIRETYSCSALYGFVKYRHDLSVEGFELSLYEPDTGARGAEYLIQENGDYKRWFRQAKLRAQVTRAEHALLDLCCPAFNALGQRYRKLISAPPNIRFRRLASDLDLEAGDLFATRFGQL